MWHWIQQAFSTYVLHSEHGNGYQWHSGPGSDLGELTLFGIGLTAIRHWNCNEPWCFRHGHPHPDHGQPVCEKHYHTYKLPPPEETND